jgi:hypothetical protein
MATVVGILIFGWWALFGSPVEPSPSSSSHSATPPVGISGIYRAPDAGGPKPVDSLAGAYRIDWTPAPNVNAAPPFWEALRSACDERGCTARGAILDDLSHQVVKSDARLDTFTFIDGRWQIDSPTPGTEPCTGEGPQGRPQAVSVREVLYPLSDSTIRGVATVIATSDVCGEKGREQTYEFTATRVGPVPDGLFRREVN